jgi:hypothetical protein
MQTSPLQWNLEFDFGFVGKMLAQMVDNLQDFSEDLSVSGKAGKTGRMRVRGRTPLKASGESLSHGLDKFDTML